MKKVGKYLTITLLFVTGLFFVGLLYLFFGPKSSLFGLTFISYNETRLTQYYDISQVEKVIVDEDVVTKGDKPQIIKKAS